MDVRDTLRVVSFGILCILVSIGLITLFSLGPLAVVVVLGKEAVVVFCPKLGECRKRAHESRGILAASIGLEKPVCAVQAVQAGANARTWWVLVVLIFLRNSCIVHAALVEAPVLFAMITCDLHHLLRRFRC